MSCVTNILLALLKEKSSMKGGQNASWSDLGDLSQGAARAKAERGQLCHQQEPPL